VQLDLLFTIAAAITACGVIVGGIIAIYRVAQKIEKSIGLDENGKTVSERLARVEHQLWENGGSSLADRVNTIETHTVRTTTELEIIKAILLGNQPQKPAPTPVKRIRKKAV
jgi:hypothetical protein